MVDDRIGNGMFKGMLKIDGIDALDDDGNDADADEEEEDRKEGVALISVIGEVPVKVILCKSTRE